MAKQTDCSELAKLITEIAMNIGSRPDVNSLDQVLARMRQLDGLESITRTDIVSAIVEAMDARRHAVSELSKKLARLKSEARGDVRLKKTIKELEGHLQAGTTPPVAKRQSPPEAQADLRKRVADLRKQINQSEPAIKKRWQKTIDRLTKQLEENDFAPRVRTETKLSRELERLEFDKNRLRRKINSHIEALKPLTTWQKIAAPFTGFRAIKTAYDLSAPFRQGIIFTVGHPIASAPAFREMIKALKSERYFQKIQDDIQMRGNAPMYARSKLYLADIDGKISAREEAFLSGWAENIPGVRASERAYIAFLNLIRANHFDLMASNLSADGNVTHQEAVAIANAVNVFTGRGNLGSFEHAADGLAQAFFAPRYVASRFQFLTGQPFYRGSLQVKKEVAKVYARFLIGVSAIATLGVLAGGSFEKDPRSSDFGKLKFGNSRLDLLGGISQSTVVSARLLSGQTKSPTTGAIKPIRGPERRFTDPTSFEVATRFLRTKFSPLTSTIVDAIAMENVVGENTDVRTLEGSGRLFGNLILPLSGQDIYESIKEQGIPGGTALGMLSLLGFGLQTFGPKTREERVRVAKSIMTSARQGRIKPGEARLRIDEVLSNREQ